MQTDQGGGSLRMKTVAVVSIGLAKSISQVMFLPLYVETYKKFMREIYLLEITYSGQIKQISLETMNLCRAI